MVLCQILKVLPAASDFQIFQSNRPVLAGHIAQFDKSLMFASIDDDLKYQKIYAGFHVELVDKGDDGIWLINL